jgi:type I restriction enzyme M protein
MRKSLGDKRKELRPDAIGQIVRMYADAIDAPDPDRVKVMRNEEFGYARLTVERPLRRKWTVTEETTAGLDEPVRMNCPTCLRASTS